jgi:hypothetical protein
MSGIMMMVSIIIIPIRMSPIVVIVETPSKMNIPIPRIPPKANIPARISIRIIAIRIIIGKIITISHRVEVIRIVKLVIGPCRSPPYIVPIDVYIPIRIAC